MPAKLDRCVKKVTTDLVKKGVNPKKARQRAWAICTASQKRASKRKSKIKSKKR